MVTTYTWTPLATDQTRMTLRNTETPRGFTTAATPLIALSMRRAMTKDLGYAQTNPRAQLSTRGSLSGNVYV